MMYALDGFQQQQHGQPPMPSSGAGEQHHQGPGGLAAASTSYAEQNQYSDYSNQPPATDYNYGYDSGYSYANGNYAQGNAMTDYTSPQTAHGPLPPMGDDNIYYDNGDKQAQSGFDNGFDRVVYQQDQAVGNDGAGSLNIDHVAPPLPVSHLHHSALAKTVSSGVGPTYIPEGRDASGGQYRIVPVRSRLFASYPWAIEGFMLSDDEKLVSLPFGPASWRWQLVIYPKGAGDGAGTHISAFIRPLRNESEAAARDAWHRPITEFTIKIRRAIPGSPIVGIPDPSEDFLVADTSESSFTGFSASMSGWGFPELLDIQNVSDAISYDGTLNIEADVVGEQSVDWAVYQYKWDIPSFLQLTEDETMSEPFGPPNYQWKIQIFRQGNKDGAGSHLSAYVLPVKSQTELTLGAAWSRPIVSLTMKLVAGENQTPLTSKTITGGFIFTDDNLDCGWPQLIELAKLNESMDWYASLSVIIEVTWDPSYDLRGSDLGRARHHIATSAAEWKAARDRLEALSQELDYAGGELVNLRSALAAAHSELSALQETSRTSEQQLHDTRTRLQTLGNIEARMAVVQKELLQAHKRVEEAKELEQRYHLAREELALARESQEQADALKVKIAGVKLRIARLRLIMEQGAEIPPEIPDAGDDEDPATMRAEMLLMKSKLFEIEQDLVAARADADAKARALADATIAGSLYDDAGQSQSNGEEQSLLDLIQGLRREILVVRGVLLEVEERPTHTIADRAALSAELAMVQAELEVARATFLTLTSTRAEEIEADSELTIEADIVGTELTNVRADMAAKRQSLEEGSDNADQRSAVFEDRATSPIRLHAPPLPYGNAAEYGFTQSAERDGLDAVPLPAGIPPPPFGMSLHALHGNDDTATELAQTHEELSYTRSELEGAQNELSHVRMQMDSARQMLVSNPTSSNAEEVLRMLFGHNLQFMADIAPPTAAFGQPVAAAASTTSWDPEFWPIEQYSKQAYGQPTKSRSIFSSFLSFTTLFLTAWFITYSTIYVLCSPSHLRAHQGAPYDGMCKTVVPGWNTMMGTWHGAAEKFVGDVAPGIGQGLKWTAKRGKVAVRVVGRKVGEGKAWWETTSAAAVDEKAESEILRDDSAVRSGTGAEKNEASQATSVDDLPSQVSPGFTTATVPYGTESIVTSAPPHKRTELAPVSGTTGVTPSESTESAGTVVAEANAAEVTTGQPAYARGSGAEEVFLKGSESQQPVQDSPAGAVSKDNQSDIVLAAESVTHSQTIQPNPPVSTPSVRQPVATEPGRVATPIEKDNIAQNTPAAEAQHIPIRDIPKSVISSAVSVISEGSSQVSRAAHDARETIGAYARHTAEAQIKDVRDESTDAEANTTPIRDILKAAATEAAPVVSAAQDAVPIRGIPQAAATQAAPIVSAVKEAVHEAQASLAGTPIPDARKQDTAQSLPTEPKHAPPAAAVTKIASVVSSAASAGTDAAKQVLEDVKTRVIPNAGVEPAAASKFPDSTQTGEDPVYSSDIPPVPEIPKVAQQQHESARTAPLAGGAQSEQEMNQRAPPVPPPVRRRARDVEHVAEDGRQHHEQEVNEPASGAASVATDGDMLNAPPLKEEGTTVGTESTESAPPPVAKERTVPVLEIPVLPPPPPPAPEVANVNVGHPAVAPALAEADEIVGGVNKQTGSTVAAADDVGTGHEEGVVDPASEPAHAHSHAGDASGTAGEGGNIPAVPPQQGEHDATADHGPRAAVAHETGTEHVEDEL
ncbi:uncharacterized protein EV422DRAFT_511968 [Fimicolochytrium jonesii]|uniref:uncharacterized protein n=1 Tax=Fimicolochytrium jonesii TaxID=1396493 RepID=UPI0022FEE88D|nr:uncharacterized protein EV422DRAFT_511968 [Fimicolochytrium jonesii]KAI8826936.1 hypothetical protein EV422DRAFT_511968 [Fimicolochytrium jonesii]